MFNNEVGRYLSQSKCYTWHLYCSFKNTFHILISMKKKCVSWTSKLFTLQGRVVLAYGMYTQLTFRGTMKGHGCCLLNVIHKSICIYTGKALHSLHFKSHWSNSQKLLVDCFQRKTEAPEESNQQIGIHVKSEAVWCQQTAVGHYSKGTVSFMCVFL